ncbi:autotransporter outer membrane beta-barrel domain-containing protein [Parasutterella secunda]|uniref:autotransporter outer membrane beta-barrel domain-containing protein n=1 Tax=Parasutterella secunda TaxID=626947 RepID=UPI0025A401D7|nr:autotransporter outer membrane beta-barrel domain-containing protein [Parasutterella secunda]MDM8087002.1 autotransporter outer membrane beta-barrel domain-containing protein [Parasutterella secunda]
MKKTLLFKALLGIWGALSFQCVSAETTFTNIEESEKEYIVDLRTHDELQLSEDLSGYQYEVNLIEPIDHALHLYFAYTKDKNAEVGNNTLTWVNGGIGTSTNPTDVYIFAAFSADSDVYNNTLNMEGGEFYPQALSDSDNEGAGKIAAAKSDSADMYGNKVVVTGGVFHSFMEIIGAYSNDQSDTNQVASYNRVVVNETDGSSPSFIGETVGGSFVAPSLYGAKLHTADVHHNWVEIESFGKKSSTDSEQNISDFQNIVGGQAASGNISDNSVVITRSKFQVNTVFGGNLEYDKDEDDKHFDANSNSVYIKDSEITFHTIVASNNLTGNAHNGTVYIENTNLCSISEDSYISGGDSWSDSSSIYNNTVHLVDVSVNKEMTIYAGGGFSLADVYDNKIILESRNDESQTDKLSLATLSGYQSFGNASNNSLIIRKWNGNIGGLSRFDSITFADFKWNEGKTILTVKGETDISSTSLNIDVNNIRFDDRLENHFGEQMTLIKGDRETGIQFNPFYDNGQEVAIPSTITQDAIGIIQNNRDDDSVDFKLQGTAPSQQLELVSNNRNMSLFFVNHGAELILDNLDATNRNYHWGLRTFASIDGVQSNYSTDGHIDVHGFTAAAGLANSVMLNGNPLLLNLFVESGKGDYTEEMSYLNIDRRFSGEVKYYGAGISARIKNTTGWYAEGSLRAGKTKTQISRGLVDGNGVAHGYDLSGNYFGVHIGAGRIIDVGENMKADLFMKYFYTYLPSDSTDIFADGVNNQFDFDSVESSRIRVGGRLYFPLQNSFWAYTGLAYQYDFTPDVHVEANGEKIADAASMRGSMGIGSLGFRYKSEDSPWVVDLKIRGYVGQREGLSGKAQVEYRY